MHYQKTDAGGTVVDPRQIVDHDPSQKTNPDNGPTHGRQRREAHRVKRRCGAIPLAGDAVRFRAWAPLAKRVELLLFTADGARLDRRITLPPEGDGHFSLALESIPDGQRYALSLDGGEPRPDPASLWQPDGVSGPSAVYRPARFAWTDDAWPGVPREDLVFYELHVGTFTPEGTFDAIIPRLPHLKDLGVTAIELMPVNQFPGGRNWGYDGVLPYAAQNTYGGPAGLQRLVDAAHRAGLAVVLDVVYNHFGPEGNYLHEFGPYFTDKYKTPWGKAVNFDDRGSDAVRAYVVDNARMWLEEFRLDGLRLDAVHAIYDAGAKHVLADIADACAEATIHTGRRHHVVAESDLNDPRVILPGDRGGHGLDAQWADDFHHAVHALLTGETRGYYADYGAIHHVARAMESPFVYAGQFSPHRGRAHGAPVPTDLAGDRFVVCVQNHDQIGNRAAGDRLSTLLDDPARRRLAPCLMLLSPYLPLLFMGEEYGERHPFPFFCSFSGPDLIEAVRQGRKREFADFVTAADAVPDPHACATFESAKLTWAWPDGTEAAHTRALYRDLLAARREWPALREPRHPTVRLTPDPDHGPLLELSRGTASAAPLRIAFNLSDQPAALADAPADALAFTSESPRYGGRRREPSAPVRELLPWECVVWRSH
ncbi:MAG TPA: malto-oligosyltrehalose trehalohydrolase [Tepidisphaeraceae bacterium]|nr:malto-oligosyltrehalose trehalohydrolase [Tepidisphaeraceae bacterium]